MTERPAQEARPPLLTKPAGVFVQLLGLVLLLTGGVTLLAGKWLGFLVIAVSLGLFAIGRQTQPRP